MFPNIVSSFGVDSNWSGDEFYIFFYSIHNSKRMYLGEDCITDNLDKAIKTEDIGFAIEELNNLTTDKEFLSYLEAEMCL